MDKELNIIYNQEGDIASILTNFQEDLDSFEIEEIKQSSLFEKLKKLLLNTNYRADNYLSALIIHINLFYYWCNKIFNSITKFRMMYNKMNCRMSIF